MGNLSDIQESFRNDRVYYTHHARSEMTNEYFGMVTDIDIFEAVSTGEIIESYSDDKPFPSVLVFGRTGKGRPLHVVCAYDADEKITFIITVYHPDPMRWTDYKRRKNQ